MYELGSDCRLLNELKYVPDNNLIQNKETPNWIFHMWRTLHIHEYNFTFNFYKLTQWWVYKKAMAEGVYVGISLYPIIIKIGQNILGILKGRKICISEGMKYSIALDREREKHHRSATAKVSWKFKVGERIFIGMIRKIFLEGVVAKMSFVW